MMEITDNGRALVQTSEFAASLINFMKEWDGPNDEGTDHVCLVFCRIEHLNEHPELLE